MYIFEFTDNEIKIYDKKRKKLIIEKISTSIIKNNKIYDYLKLNVILKRIVDKYKLINTLFKVKIQILIFEKMSPSEIYLFKNVFNNISNISVEIVNVYKMFTSNCLFISGDIVYYDNSILKKIKKGDYILVGNSDNYDVIKNNLEKKYKINILEYENSNTIIYETL